MKKNKDSASEKGGKNEIEAYNYITSTYTNTHTSINFIWQRKEWTIHKMLLYKSIVYNKLKIWTLYVKPNNFSVAPWYLTLIFVFSSLE